MQVWRLSRDPFDPSGAGRLCSRIPAHLIKLSFPRCMLAWELALVGIYITYDALILFLFLYDSPPAHHHSTKEVPVNAKVRVSDIGGSSRKGWFCNPRVGARTTTFEIAKWNFCLIMWHPEQSRLWSPEVLHPWTNRTSRGPTSNHSQSWFTLLWQNIY